MAATSGSFALPSGGTGAVLARAVPAPGLIHGAAPRVPSLRPNVAQEPGALARATPPIPVVLNPIRTTPMAPPPRA